MDQKLEAILSNTAYDDVFRTLVNECHELVLPLINEMFGEHYTGDEEILSSYNEHFLNRQDSVEEKRITDTSFVVAGEEQRHYHLECESSSGDHTILIRLFEYDAQIALDQEGRVYDNRLVVSFPHTAVLYLRSTKTTRDEMEVLIRTPGGAVSYMIPVMKVKDYTIDEIFEKNLLFLIPFYIFTYEADFRKIENDPDRLNEMKQQFIDIRMRLEQLSMEEKISAFSKKTLFDMAERVIVNLAQKHEKILEGVGQVMTGTVLDFEAKRIRDKGREEGLEEGMEKGLEKGEEKMASLVSSLTSQGRYDDLLKAATDKEARKLLFVEFGLK